MKAILITFGGLPEEVILVKDETLLPQAVKKELDRLGDFTEDDVEYIVREGSSDTFTNVDAEIFIMEVEEYKE